MRKSLVKSKSTRLLFMEILIGVILSASSLFLFLKITYKMLQKEVTDFDVIVSNFIQSLRTPELTEIMIHITFLGSLFVFILISILMGLYIFSKNKKDLVYYLSIIYGGLVFSLVLKYIIQRPRPEISMITENTYSYPSWHAMNSFILFATLSYFIFRLSRNLKLTILITVISIVLIFLIGFSRIYLGVHYPSDIIAGYVAGFFWFVSAILFEKAIIFKRLNNNKK